MIKHKAGCIGNTRVTMRVEAKCAALCRFGGRRKAMKHEAGCAALCSESGERQ